MHQFKLGRLNGQLCLVYRDADGTRRRYRLGTNDPIEAQRRAPAVFAEVTRPRGRTVADLWRGYLEEMAGRPVATDMRTSSWPAIAARFGALSAEDITRQDCLAFLYERRAAGISDATIHSNLGRLRMVLKWAERRGLIARAPHIERPPAPPPREAHLTRDQVQRLIGAAAMPHIRLFIILAIGTGARRNAILGLTWERVNWVRGVLDLREDLGRPVKGRAVVPMNRTVRAALEEAQRGALSPYVIEWGGLPVKSVRKGLATAARAAGLTGVHPHLFRHSAAVQMAEAGVPMAEIAQFLGHSSERVTERIYARFSPGYLSRAASVLEY